MSDFIVKKAFAALTTNELYQIMDLRARVFVMEQRILYVDTDYYDQKSLHYFIKDPKGKIISYMRLIKPGVKYDEWAIGRVATDPAYRHQGLATKLVKAAIDDVKASIRISGQAYLKDYYERLGFDVVKGPYIEEDILHYEMLYEVLT